MLCRWSRRRSPQAAAARVDAGVAVLMPASQCRGRRRLTRPFSANTTAHKCIMYWAGLFNGGGGGTGHRGWGHRAPGVGVGGAWGRLARQRMLSVTDLSPWIKHKAGQLLGRWSWQKAQARLSRDSDVRRRRLNVLRPLGLKGLRI